MASEATIVPTLYLEPASDTSTPSDGITVDATPTFSGVSLPLSRLLIVIGGTSFGVVTADENGNFSFTTPNFSDMSGSLGAQAQVFLLDEDDNVIEASNYVNFLVDLSAPSAPTIAFDPISDTGIVGDGITKNLAPTITGATERNVTVEIYANNTVLLGSVRSNATDGTFNFTAPNLGTLFSDAAVLIRARVIDNVENVGPLSQPLTVVLDSTPPAAPTLFLDALSDTGLVGDGVTNDATPSFHGQAEAFSTIQIIAGGSTLLGTTVADANGNFAFTTPNWSDMSGTLGAVIQVNAIDAAGNSGALSAAVNFLVDLTAPELPVFTAAGGLGNGIAANTALGAVVGVLTSGGSSAFSIEPGSHFQLDATDTDLSDGQRVVLASAISGAVADFKASAIDLAGNQSTAMTFSQPVVTIVSVNDAPVLDLNGAAAGLNGATTFAEGPGAVVLAPQALVSDIDSANLNGGILNIGFDSGATSSDLIGVRNEGTGVGQIGVSGSTVTYGGVTIGAIRGGGPGGNMVVDFTSNAATPEAVQALARNITLTNTSDAPPNGARPLLWVLTDGAAGATTVNSTVTITPVNDVPQITTPLGTAAQPGLQVDENFSGSLTTLAGFDPDGQTLGWSLGADFEPNYDNEAFKIDPLTGELSLTIAQDYASGGIGGDNLMKVRVVVSDGVAQTSSDLWIGVRNVNDVPIAAATKVVTTLEDTASAALAVGATDADGDALTYSIKNGAGPSKGGVTFADGSFVYTPTANANGSDSFTILVSDGQASVEQAVSVTITAVNDPATINGNSLGSLTEDATQTSTGGALTIVDSDAGEATFQAPTSLVGVYGTFTFQATTGAWGYTLDNSRAATQALTAGQAVHDTLSVTSLDGTATRLIDVTVNGADEATSGVITGGSGGEFLFGTAGSDLIYAGAGFDFVSAGDGDDIFVAQPGDGNDAYLGGDDSDTYDFSATTAAADVDLGGALGFSVGVANGAQIGFDILVSIENALGGSGNDTIEGSRAGGRLDGGGGADRIVGFAGTDTIIGGLGNDRLTGGGGNDTFVFRAGFGRDVITDFSRGTSSNHDKLDLRGLGFADAAAVLAATDGTTNAVIHVGTDEIALMGVTKAQLAAASYVFLL